MGVLTKEAEGESRAAVITGKRDALTQKGRKEEGATASAGAQTGLIHVLR